MVFAEAVGFEPTKPFRVCRISSAVHSTTLPRLLWRIYISKGNSEKQRSVPLLKQHTPERFYFVVERNQEEQGEHLIDPKERVPNGI